MCFRANSLVYVSAQNVRFFKKTVGMSVICKQHKCQSPVVCCTKNSGSSGGTIKCVDGPDAAHTTTM